MNTRVKQMQSSTVRTIIAGFIVFCLLISAFMPRISLDSSERDTLEKVFQSQSSLLHVFCMTAVPLSIIDDFLPSRGASPRGTHAKDSPGSADRMNYGYEYSMIGFDRGPLAGKWVQQRCASPVNDIPAMVAVAFLLLLLDRLREGWRGERSARVSGRMRFFLLPRSSVGDHAGIGRSVAFR